MNIDAAYRRDRWMSNLRVRVAIVVDLMTLCRRMFIRLRLKGIIMSTNCTVSGDEEEGTRTTLLDVTQDRRAFTDEITDLAQPVWRRKPHPEAGPLEAP